MSKTSREPVPDPKLPVAIAEVLQADRWRRGTLRTVLRGEDGRVYKRFWIPTGNRVATRSWDREAAALRQLSGGGFSELHFLDVRQRGEGLHIVLCKDFVEGEVQSALSEADVPALADLLARVHRRMVVIDDVTAGNLARVPEGTLSCIDFGRAVTFRSRSPLFYWWLGWELAKTRQYALRNSSVHFERLWTVYCKSTGFGTAAHRLILFSMWMSRSMRYLRKQSRVGRVWAYLMRGCQVPARLRFGRYPGGHYLVDAKCFTPEPLERFIRELRFLETEGVKQLSNHNKRYQVFEVTLPEFPGRTFILKRSWASPRYRPMRRFNVALSNWLRDYGRRAFLGALWLHRAGIPTIQPAACWRYRSGMFRFESYLLYEKVAAAYSLRDYRLNVMGLPDDVHQPLIERLYGELADTISRMHDAGIRHDDIASGNFLVAGSAKASPSEPPPEGWRVVVIDTDHVRYAWWPTLWLRRYFGLRCLRRLDLDEPMRRRFMQRYLGPAYSEFWWRVSEFWRAGGNRPVRMVWRWVLRGRKKS